MQLREVAIKDLLMLEIPTDDIYTYKDGEFFVCISQGSAIKKETLKDLLRQKVKNIFVHSPDYNIIKERLKNELLRVTRSLSVGNPIENSKRQVQLLSQNMTELYKDPLNDENLKLQYQCTVNLSKFLVEHRNVLTDVYADLVHGNHHFTISQPMLTSLLVVGFLQHFHLFHEKDIEMLFITSYFKDLGMSFIPDEQLNKKDLDKKERKIISKHADNSISLLEGRVPLSRNYLNIIKNHHFLNHKIQATYQDNGPAPANKVLHGLETEVVAVMDVIVEMISDRPYREGRSLFK